MEGKGVREYGTLQEFQVIQYGWGTENKEKTKHPGDLCMSDIGI